MTLGYDINSILSPWKIKGHSGTRLFTTVLTEAPATLKRDITEASRTLGAASQSLEWCKQELASIQASIDTMMEGGTNNETC